MFTNYLPWDFVKASPHLLAKKNHGLIALQSFDPFIEKIFLGKIPRSLFEDKKLHVLVGSELTQEWIEENILTLDFFSSNLSYLVLFADDISAKTKKYIFENTIDWGNRFFILSFGSDSKNFEDYKKSVTGEFIKIDAPRFWENQKLLDFLSEQLGVSLSLHAKNIIIDRTPATPGEYLAAIKNLSLRLERPAQATAQEVNEIIDSTKVDNFALADQWGAKNFYHFYLSLLTLSEDYDSLRNFFLFMNGHILKIIDVTVLSKKSKLSKYDQKILQLNKSWEFKDLMMELDKFSELELLTKTKSANLKTSLQRHVLLNS